MTGVVKPKLGTDWGLPIASEMEFRQLPEGGTHFAGYAAVFNSESDPRLGWTEVIEPGAFKRSLSTDGRIHNFVVDHDEAKLLASTRTKHLRLGEDSRGLHVEADLPNTSYARDVVELYERGEVRSMSFSFKPSKGGEKWSGNRRSLSDLQLGHVSVLTGQEPVYPNTTLQIRSLASEFGASPDDLTGMLDAINEQRRMTPDEWALFQSLAIKLGPEEATEQPAPEVPATQDETRSVEEWRARLATFVGEQS